MHGAKQIAASYLMPSWLKIKISHVTKNGGWFS